MFNHLLKITWNKKKKNFLVILEVFVSFIVLFAVFSMLLFRYQNYKLPMGFKYDNVWAVNIFTEARARNVAVTDSAASYHEPVVQVLRNYPEIERSSFTSFNTPFFSGAATTMLNYQGTSIIADNFNTDDNYFKVLDLTLLEGRWYDKKDDGLPETPIVINQAMRDKLFRNTTAVGKTLLTGPNNEIKLRIVGVVNNFKDKGDFAAVNNSVFVRMNEKERQAANTLLIKMKPGVGAGVEERLNKALTSAVKDGNVRIDHLADRRQTKNKEVLIPMIILLIVCSFLIANVGLGLFGVLWYNINSRKAELGLRRAVGATGSGVSLQLIGEALAMATIAMLIGTFFAVQFPLLNVFDLSSGIYITAIILSVVFIYLLVVLCALYPGSQAAKIYPAVALHED